MHHDDYEYPENQHHPDPTVLAAVALGEDVDQTDHDHLVECVVCLREIDALSKTLHRVRDLGPDRLASPPERVWAAIAADLDAAPDAEATVSARSDDDRKPRLVSVPSEPSQPNPPADSSRLNPTSTAAIPTALGRRRNRFSTGWLVAAAVAGLLVGGIGGVGFSRAGQQESPAAATIATAQLDTLDDSKQELGQARLVRANGALDLDVDTAGFSADGGYLEVWLINQDLKRMVSIGVLRSDQRKQQFAIDQTLIDQGYTILDISREPFDNSPQHSGKSIVRGKLTA